MYTLQIVFFFFLFAIAVIIFISSEYRLEGSTDLTKSIININGIEYNSMTEMNRIIDVFSENAVKEGISPDIAYFNGKYDQIPEHRKATFIQDLYDKKGIILQPINLQSTDGIIDTIDKLDAYVTQEYVKEFNLDNTKKKDAKFVITLMGDMTPPKTRLLLNCTVIEYLSTNMKLQRSDTQWSGLGNLYLNKKWKIDEASLQCFAKKGTTNNAFADVFRGILSDLPSPTPPASPTPLASPTAPALPTAPASPTPPIASPIPLPIPIASPTPIATPTATPTALASPIPLTSPQSPQMGNYSPTVSREPNTKTITNIDDSQIENFREKLENDAYKQNVTLNREFIINAVASDGIVLSESTINKILAPRMQFGGDTFLRGKFDIDGKLIARNLTTKGIANGRGLSQKSLTGGNISGIEFTKEFSEYPDMKNMRNGAEISNDTTRYKALMIVGNKSMGDNKKRVLIRDNLEVENTLNITGGENAQLCINGMCLDPMNFKIPMK